MNDESRILISRLQAIIDDLYTKLLNADVGEKQNKIHGISDSIAILEKNGLDVPESLIKEKQSLLSEVECLSEADETMKYLSSSFDEFSTQLKYLNDKRKVSKRKSHPKKRSRSNRSSDSPSEKYACKKVRSFLFEGKEYPARTWKSYFMQVCELMLSLHPDKFERILSINGRKRQYFSKNPDGLKCPKIIPGTDIYCETNFSTTKIIHNVNVILNHFGHDESEIKIVFDE